MADKVKSLKKKLDDGTFSAKIPIGVDSEYVDMANGKNLQTTMGTINVDTDGSVATQLGKKANASEVNTALAGKADTSTTYTKTQVDSLISKFLDWEEVQTW